jgi:mono/diheme cytochrome c family protein
LIRRKIDIPAAAAEAAIVLIVIGLVFVAALAGWAVGHGRTHTRTVTVGGALASSSSSSAAIDPHVAAGAHDFTQFACSQCHGLQGRGGVSPDVPALTSVGKALTAARLRSIIDHGLGESKNPTKPYMPVWGLVISKQQVSELIAYLRAGLPTVPTAEPPPIPEGQGLPVEGAAL